MQFWNIIMKKINFDTNNKIGEELKKNMNEFYENPKICMMEYDGNESDSEPEVG